MIISIIILWNQFLAQATNVVNYNIVNSSGIKIGARTSYICNVNQYPAGNNTFTAQPEAASKSKYRPMSENVEELSTCEEELAFEDMLIIKTHVGHGWRDVARRLSYSDGQIEQFEENYRHEGIDEVNIEFYSRLPYIIAWYLICDLAWLFKQGDSIDNKKYYVIFTLTNILYKK